MATGAEHRHHRRVRWMVAVVLVGCSASHGVDQGAQAFIDAIDDALCEREMRCEAQIDGPWARYHCHPSAGPYWAGAPRATASGDLSFDAAAAEACLTELDAVPCHFEMNPTPSCSGVFTPVRALGDRCTPHPNGFTGCTDGAFCASSDGVRGTCVRGGAPGETCDVRPCAATRCLYLAAPATPVCEGLEEGDACTGSCGELPCEDGTCVALPTRALGEPCGVGVAACVEDAHCVEGTCHPLASAGQGEPCFDRRTCASDLWCDRSGRCAPRLGPGATCTSSIQCGEDAPRCTRGICSVELLSDAPTCRLGNGIWPGSGTCEDPALACNRMTLQCRPVVALGAACDSYTEVCEEGARCTDGRCVTIVSVDAACGADAVCAATLECRGGRCAALPLPGEPCTETCLAGECIAGECTMRPGGAACDEPEQCQSSQCFAGLCQPVSGEGGPCGTVAGRCAMGLVCLGDENDVGRCFRMPSR